MNTRLIYVRKNVFNLTQQEFAGKLGLNRATLSQYERGHTPIPKYTLKLISLLFGINEIWLASGEGSIFNSKEDYQPAAVRESGLAKDLKHLKEIIETLELYPEIEEHVYHYVKMLITNPNHK